MTAAERVKAYLDSRARRDLINSDLISWSATDDNEEHQLTVADLRALLLENLTLRAQDHEGALRAAEAYRDALKHLPFLPGQQLQAQEEQRRTAAGGVA